MYKYDIWVVTEDFLSGDPNILGRPDEVAGLQWLHSHLSDLKRLENTECIKAYANRLPTTRSDVLVVASNLKSNNSLLQSITFIPRQP